jgi:hypothetical protein
MLQQSLPGDGRCIMSSSTVGLLLGLGSVSFLEEPSAPCTQGLWGHRLGPGLLSSGNQLSDLPAGVLLHLGASELLHPVRDVSTGLDELPAYSLTCHESVLPVKDDVLQRCCKTNKWVHISREPD